MGSIDRYDPSHYEVRCPRCEVSFPPETRQCLHCGGPTSKPGPNRGLDWVFRETDSMQGRTTTRQDDAARTRQDEEDVRFSTVESIGQREDGGAGPQTEEESGSLPRTLLRTFGSLIWIVVLIAFTLARDCGGE